MDLEYGITSYLAMRQAMDFHRSAEIIDENGLTRPTMVNITFACELYMKAIILWSKKNNDVIREHELEPLFAMLPESIAAELRKEFDDDIWKCNMRDSSDAFRQWRYYYEQDKVRFGHVGWLFELAEKLKEICQREIILENAKLFQGKNG